jgi:hypothetical protein
MAIIRGERGPHPLERSHPISRCMFMHLTDEAETQPWARQPLGERDPRILHAEQHAVLPSTLLH